MCRDSQNIMGGVCGVGFHLVRGDRGVLLLIRNNGLSCLVELFPGGIYGTVAPGLLHDHAGRGFPRLPVLQRTGFLPDSFSAARVFCSALFHISDTQMGYVTDVEPGHGLLRVAGAVIPFDCTIPQESELYRLMNTTPGRG